MGVFRGLISLYVFLASLQGFACSDIEELRFAHWMDESASAQESIGVVNVIEQDAQGVIWAGGQNGLARFNGNRFTLFRYSINDANTISNSYVSSIVNDAHGVLWVGTHAGINAYNDRTERFTRYDHLNGALPADNINSLLYENGRLWIGTTQGLWVLNKDAVRAEEIRVLHGTNIGALHAGKSGELWLGTSNGVALSQAGCACAGDG
jgi:ligand-binding sensor domain-containing protein